MGLNPSFRFLTSKTGSMFSTYLVYCDDTLNEITFVHHAGQIIFTKVQIVFFFSFSVFLSSFLSPPFSLPKFSDFKKYQALKNDELYTLLLKPCLIFGCF